MSFQLFRAVRIIIPGFPEGFIQVIPAIQNDDQIRAHQKVGAYHFLPPCGGSADNHGIAGVKMNHILRVIHFRFSVNQQEIPDVLVDVPFASADYDSQGREALADSDAVR